MVQDMHYMLHDLLHRIQIQLLNSDMQMDHKELVLDMQSFLQQAQIQIKILVFQQEEQDRLIY